MLCGAPTVAPRGPPVRHSASRASRHMPFAQIALPLPLRQTFAYRIPAELVAAAVPGAEVQVPFRRRPLKGVVLGLSATTDRERVEDVQAVLGEPLLSAHLLAL